METLQAINAGESVEQREPPTPMLGMEIGSSHCGGHWAGSLAIKMRMKLECSLTPYTKINSKEIKDLNKRTDTMKLLRKREHTLI